MDNVKRNIWNGHSRHIGDIGWEHMIGDTEDHRGGMNKGYVPCVPPYVPPPRYASHALHWT